jgi:hypothetical protein
MVVEDVSVLVVWERGVVVEVVIVVVVVSVVLVMVVEVVIVIVVVSVVLVMVVEEVSVLVVWKIGVEVMVLVANVLDTVVAQARRYQITVTSPLAQVTLHSDISVAVRPIDVITPLKMMIGYCALPSKVAKPSVTLANCPRLVVQYPSKS